MVVDPPKQKPFCKDANRGADSHILLWKQESFITSYLRSNVAAAIKQFFGCSGKKQQGAVEKWLLGTQRKNLNQRTAFRTWNAPKSRAVENPADCIEQKWKCSSSYCLSQDPCTPLLPQPQLSFSHLLLTSHRKHAIGRGKYWSYPFLVYKPV